MESKAFLDALHDAGVKFFTGVPDSYLHGFCSELAQKCEANNNVIAANEGNAVAIATGHYLATGQTSLVYLQNSGLGNAVNPLASLACEGMLGIPMILLVGWRGILGTSIMSSMRCRGVLLHPCLVSSGFHIRSLAMVIRLVM